MFFVSPTQINAQIPYEVQDANSISCFVRIQHADGSVTVTTALGVPIAPQNPGLYAGTGQDPRPATAFHSSSYATGLFTSRHGTITAGDTGTITIGDRAYYYTVNLNDTLESVQDGFIALINSNPEEKVVACGGGSVYPHVPARESARTRGRWHRPGNHGQRELHSGVDRATNPTMCCANVAGAPVTPNNPAVPGEIIGFYGTGLGLITPDVARQAIVDGSGTTDPAVNDPVAFVSSLINNTTANVVSASLMVGGVGIYEVLLELGGGTAPSPAAQVTISLQDIYTSNVVTIPVSNPLAPTP